MKTLAVDIGGTKFGLALFEDDRMIRRESRPTNREGAKDWMLEQVVAIASQWKRESGFERCGIGFGGPVDFRGQRVAFSTHVGGWNDFHLTEFLSNALGVPAIMDNDANVGALGEATYGAGRGHSPLVLHDAFDRHRRRNLRRWKDLARRRRVGGRNRASDHPARWTRMSVQSARLLRAHVLRAVDGTRSRKDRQGIARRPEFCRAICSRISRLV